MTGPHHCGICGTQLRYHTAQDTYSCPDCRLTVTAEALWRRLHGEKPVLMREYRDIRTDGELLQHWQEVITTGDVPLDCKAPSYISAWVREAREFLSDGSWASNWQTVITSYDDLIPAMLKPVPKDILKKYKDLIDGICSQSIQSAVSGACGIPQAMPHKYEWHDAGKTDEGVNLCLPQSFVVLAGLGGDPQVIMGIDPSV